MSKENKQRKTLIDARLDKGLTQAELAKKVGISEAMMSQLESCARTGSVETWDKLERALGIPQQRLREIS